MAASDQLVPRSLPLHGVLASENDLPSPPDNTLTKSKSNWPVLFFVSILAFLLASFPAWNFDFWSHLAAGRNLIQGRIAAESLAALTSGSRFQPFLIYDLLLYGIYSTVGGAGLVVVKALLVAGIAVMLFQLSREGTNCWTPAFCTTLAILAMGTRLLLQPATVSCLMLALTFLLMRNRTREPALKAISVLPPWPMLLLFVTWANVDSWFVVGLGVVALGWLGQVIDEPSFAGKWIQAFARRALSVVLLAIVCLINPAHIQAFAVSAELVAAGSTFASTVREVNSPFARAYFEGVGQTPVGLAFYPLLGMGLLSFVWNLPRCRWQRLLPWLGLVALSAVQARAVPFFAIVAGPVLAWNLQEITARCGSWQSWQHRNRRFLDFVGPPLAMMLGGILLACAWTGWLQAPPFEPRRWAVELPPSIERGAATINRWREEGKLAPDTRWLHMSPETASAFAWSCPREQGLFDERLSAAIRGQAPSADLSQQMRAAGINRVLLYDADPDRLLAGLGRLLSDPDHWPLLNLEGDLVIFGWRDPDKRGTPNPFQESQLDLDRLAFHPADDKKAPSQQPKHGPETHGWWTALWKRSPPRTIDGSEATLYLFYAEVLRRIAPFRHKAVWDASQSASVTGAALTWTGPAGLLDARARLALLEPQLPEPNASISTLPAFDQLGWMMQKDRFTKTQDDIPPALLYLAVRSARRAVAANPADAQAYLVLGECYLRFLHSTRERAWGLRSPEIVHLRRLQASAAFNQAILLKPNIAQAHLGLSELYKEMSYLDLTLKHRRIWFELVRHKDSDAAAIPKAIRDQEAQYEKEIAQLSKHLDQQLKSFSAEAGKMRLLDRAKSAERAGLAEKARDLLLESDVAAFGSEGMKLELDLLLKTGRTQDVCDWLSPDHEAMLGAPTYLRLRALALAATGDYAEAELECDRLARSVAYEDDGRERIPLHRALAMMIGQAVLDDHSEEMSMAFLAFRAFRWMHFGEQAMGLVMRMRQEADAHVIRGLIALEEGEVFEARIAFRTALAVWKDEAAAASGAGLDFAGRTIAQDCLNWLK